MINTPTSHPELSDPQGLVEFFDHHPNSLNEHGVRSTTRYAYARTRFIVNSMQDVPFQLWVFTECQNPFANPGLASELLSVLQDNAMLLRSWANYEFMVFLGAHIRHALYGLVDDRDGMLTAILHTGEEVCKDDVPPAGAENAIATFLSHPTRRRWAHELFEPFPDPPQQHHGLLPTPKRRAGQAPDDPPPGHFPVFERSTLPRLHAS